ncbi:hypothetical protein AKO1_008830 [Acrasis kona]|uniref:Transcription factor CBF/NF-Y/archaeal histone domain-containing protein n=1 Tax=Acrasis kona TaxID=1008807 RepID=A0AAW2ZFY3_9EUKA
MQFHDYSYKHGSGPGSDDDKKKTLFVNIPPDQNEKEKKPKKRGRQPNSARVEITNPTITTSNAPQIPDSPTELDDGKRRKFRATFPMARIKKIMQLDDDVGKIAAAVPVLVSKCLEMFIGSLIDNAKEVTKTKGAKTMTLQHLKECIDGNEKFNFLKEKVKDIPMNWAAPEQPTKPKRTRQPKAPKDPNEPKVPKKRGRKKKVEEKEEEDEEEDEEDEDDDATPQQAALMNTFSFQPSLQSPNRTQPPPFLMGSKPQPTFMPPPSSPGMKIPEGSPIKRRKLSMDNEEGQMQAADPQKNMMNTFSFNSQQLPSSPKLSPTTFNQQQPAQPPQQMMFFGPSSNARNQTQPDTPRPNTSPFFPTTASPSSSMIQPPQFSLPTFTSSPNTSLPSFAPPAFQGLGSSMISPPPMLGSTGAAPPPFLMPQFLENNNNNENTTTTQSDVHNE